VDQYAVQCTLRGSLLFVPKSKGQLPTVPRSVSTNVRGRESKGDGQEHQTGRKSINVVV
jgi:hypothetical protein